MIIVTGGAGFIGSQIVKGLNQQGIDDIIIVDDLTDGTQFLNLRDLHFQDYIDHQAFRELMNRRDPSLKPYLIYHQGACSTTTEWNGRFMMDNNFTYSKELLHFALHHKAQFLYASSAAVYGNEQTFSEESTFERPINVYGYSKLLFDQYVRRLWQSQNDLPQIVGLRYFNVYGPGEQHKGSMASVAWHFHRQILQAGECCLFQGTQGYTDGEQLRDFIFVNDVVKVNQWLKDNQQVNGIFNVGTGRAQSFNDVARAVINYLGQGQIRYIEFPDKLKDAYQSYTQADISRLRQAGYSQQFKAVTDGVAHYLAELGIKAN